MRRKYRIKPAGYVVIGILVLVAALCIYAIVKAVGPKQEPDKIELEDITPTPTLDVITPIPEETDDSFISGEVQIVGNEDEVSVETASTPAVIIYEEEPATPTPKPTPTATPRVPTSKEKKNAKVGMLTGDGVNLRKGPGTNFERLGSYKKGATMLVYAKDGDFYFVKMDKDDKIGFMSTKYVTTDVAPEVTDAEAPAGSVSGSVRASKVALRSEADKTSTAITQLARGDQVFVFKKSGDFYYVQVASSGKKGYAFAEFISLSGPLPE